jgi:hypothetical protein
MYLLFPIMKREWLKLFPKVLEVCVVLQSIVYIILKMSTDTLFCLFRTWSIVYRIRYIG